MNCNHCTEIVIIRVPLIVPSSLNVEEHSHKEFHFRYNNCRLPIYSHLKKKKKNIQL